MKKTIVTIILLLVILGFAQAQKAKDVLYLKNGSVIFGELIEITNDTYKIRTNDGSLFVYPSDEVDRYQKTESSFSDAERSDFGLGLEAGFLIGSQSSDYIAPFSFNALLIYRPGPVQSFAAGGGVEFLGVSFMPLFIEYKQFLTNKQTSPFLFVRGGYLANLGGDVKDDPYDYYYYNRDYKGGATFTLGTGICWHKENYDMNLSFAFRYARTSYKSEEYYSNAVTYETNWKRLEVKFGFSF